VQINRPARRAGRPDVNRRGGNLTSYLGYYAKDYGGRNVTNRCYSFYDSWGRLCVKEDGRFDGVRAMRWWTPNRHFPAFRTLKRGQTQWEP
jgi:hypothetical protein